jgi:isopenicillin-N epimerase
MTDAALAKQWTLDPEVTFLNHGSFGACPRVVLEHQTELRARLEREPIQFFVRALPGLLDEARAVLARFVGAPEDELVFVPNATHAVSLVLSSEAANGKITVGDELVVTSHGYNACTNAITEIASRTGARVRTASVPFPCPSPEAVFEAVVETFTDKTRLLLIDHVTSPSALVLPIERVVAEARRRGITTVIDGAHAPGMIPLTLGALGADYYTGNLHKWVCAPKGAAFLHVRRALRDGLRPLVISHGRNSPRMDRHKMLIEHDWMGTMDPTAMLCVPAALAFLTGLVPGGIAALAARGRALAIEARAMLCEALGVEAPAPSSMLGTMATVRFPAGEGAPPADALALDATQLALFDEHRVEVPIMPWPRWPERHLRISAAPYNDVADIERLIAALGALGIGNGGAARERERVR